MNVYDDECTKRIYAIVRMSSTLAEACDWVRSSMGLTVTKDGLQKIFKRRGWGAPSDCLAKCAAPPTPVDPTPMMRGANVAGLDFEDDLLTMPGIGAADTDPAPSREVEFADEEVLPRPPAKQSKQNELRKKLFDLTKRGPVPFEELCDKLDMSPARAKALVDGARADGMHIHVEHDHVGYRVPDDGSDGRLVHDVGIPPVVGQRQTIAALSDTHLGSKYCLREQLKDFVHRAYDRGIRKILHPGDVLEGMYRHAMFEVSHVGIEDQALDLFETLPHLPGLSYHAIDGNHDFVFTDNSGVATGKFIERFFAERGRTDFKNYGARSAFLRVGGAKIHLWHPKKGVGYARTYGLQKQVEKYSSSEKPQILLTGHWHVHATCYERGVHAIACPTFQGGGSAFGKSLGGAPAIGGLILSWDLTAGGTMRDFVLEYRAYFERERFVEIGDEEREEYEVSAA